MPGQPGLPNLTAMRGRRKGGAPTPQPRTLQGIAAHADAFLANLAARLPDKVAEMAARLNKLRGARSMPALSDPRRRLYGTRLHGRCGWCLSQGALRRIGASGSYRAAISNMANSPGASWWVVPVHSAPFAMVVWSSLPVES